MTCEKCKTKFIIKGNQAVRTTGEKIIICPNCGNETVKKLKKIVKG